MKKEKLITDIKKALKQNLFNNYIYNPLQNFKDEDDFLKTMKDSFNREEAQTLLDLTLYLCDMGLINYNLEEKAIGNDAYLEAVVYLEIKKGIGKNVIWEEDLCIDYTSFDAFIEQLADIELDIRKKTKIK